MSELKFVQAISEPDSGVNMLTQCTTIFFDLDGTLVDPVRGITCAFNSTLRILGYPELPTERLLWCIGPPLRESFQKLLATNAPELIEAAVSEYRVAYQAFGMYENDVYPNLVDVLAELHSRGFELFVLTAKAAPIARKIVSFHGFDAYFRDVFGPELDGRFDKKSELLAHVIETLELDPLECVVVGDRSNDMHAATSNGVLGVGVTWGYGTAEELNQSGAFILANSPHALREILAPEIPFTE